VVAEPAVLYEVDGHIATVTFNRPEARNAVNPEVIVRLADTWDAIDADDNVRVAILTGTGGHFCAGADLDKLVGKLMRGGEPADEFEARIQQDYSIIYKGFLRNHRLAKPLVAAIEGFCLAGGGELLQSCDVRVAARSAELGITEARWGLFPIAGSTVRLKRQIPWTKAMEMLLTAGRYPAEEALSFGLIGHITEDGQALAKAKELADQIASNGPLAVRKIKQSVVETEFLPEEEALEKELQLGMEVMMSNDAREGPKAFKEKRDPNFTGT
jgi:enoyl-CoA hydratase